MMIDESRPSVVPRCVHGGKQFDVIGRDFSRLASLDDVVAADVLDAWYPPSPNALKLIENRVGWVSRSSPPTWGEGLKQAIARSRGVAETSLILGAGSSDLIFRVVPSLVPQERPIIIPMPAYGEYAHVLGQLHSRHVVHLCTELSEFKPSIPQILESAYRHDAQAVILVNPCNPTGQSLTGGEMRMLLAELPATTLLIVDETYVDYLGAGASLEGDVEDHPQLVIIKSMSKIYGLSGLRVGYAVMHSDLAARLDRMTPPYVVSTLAQMAGIEALSDRKYTQDMIEATGHRRKYFQRKLAEISSLRTLESDANFFLIDVGEARLNASEIIKHLARRNIFLRDISSQGFQTPDRYIRTAVLDYPQIDRIVDAIKSLEL